MEVKINLKWLASMCGLTYNGWRVLYVDYTDNPNSITIHLVDTDKLELKEPPDYSIVDALKETDPTAAKFVDKDSPEKGWEALLRGIKRVIDGKEPKTT